MKLFRSAILFFLGAGVVYADIDSSDIIFNDTQIHQYELTFYCDNWEDSLTYYKSLPDEEYIPARMVYRINRSDSIVLDSIGVRYKGNSSYAFAGSSPKKPFKFSFDKYIDGRRFFNVKKLNFSNGAKDPTMMREKISYDILSRYMPAPRAAFATIAIEGKMVGLFTQVEQVDKLFLSRHFGKTGGNLFKASDNGSTLLYIDANQSSYEDDYELKTNESTNDWSSFVRMVLYLNNSSDDNFVGQAGGMITLDNVCRYLAFNMVFSNFDSYTGSGRNYYLYDNPSDGRFTLIPWDLNLSFGAFTNSWNVTTNDVVAVANLDERPMNRRIIGNDSLRQVYLRYIQEMIAGPASVDSIAERAETLRSIIDSAVQADSNKLHTYNEFVMNIDTNVSITDGFSRSNVPGLKSFCRKRANELETQLEQYVAVINNYNRYTATAAIPSFRCRVQRYGGFAAIDYSLPRTAIHVRLSIFSATGRRVAAFDLGAKASGIWQQNIDIAGLGRGYFIAHLTVDAGTSTITASSTMIIP